MIISVAALAAALIPLLLGGRLSRLAAIPFRHVNLIVGALATQIVIIEVLPGPAPLLQAAHIATYAIAGWFILANRRIPGLWLIATGAGLNGITITLNGGILPARLAALQAAGIHVTHGEFVNSGILPHPRLAFLGDIFAVPAGLPLANVFSIGDILIVLGTGWTAWAVLGTRWTRPRTLPLHRPAAEYLVPGVINGTRRPPEVETAYGMALEQKRQTNQGYHSLDADYPGLIVWPEPSPRWRGRDGKCRIFPLRHSLFPW
jgi:hypothetical protein